MYHTCAGASGVQKRMLGSVALNSPAVEPPFCAGLEEQDLLSALVHVSSLTAPFCPRTPHQSPRLQHLECSATSSVLHLSVQDNNACSVASCERAAKMAALSAFTVLYNVIRLLLHQEIKFTFQSYWFGLWDLGLTELNRSSIVSVLRPQLLGQDSVLPLFFPSSDSCHNIRKQKSTWFTGGWKLMWGSQTVPDETAHIGEHRQYHKGSH